MLTRYLKNRCGVYIVYTPVAAETADLTLDDIKGQRVTAQDTRDALNSATSGSLREGNVGGGTGMVYGGGTRAVQLWQVGSIASGWHRRCPRNGS